jgi:cytochrome P450
MGSQARVAAIERAVRFNPLEPAFRANPYPTYARLRDEAPYLRTLGTLVLTRYRDVLEVLKSRQFSVDLIPTTITRHAIRLGVSGIEQVDRFIRNSIVFTNNPEHARLRVIVNQAYLPAVVKDLAPLIGRQVDRLLSSIPAGGACDLIRDLAAPLPLHVLCDWMQVPVGNRGAIAGHIHVIRYLLDPGMARRAQLEDVIYSLAVLTTFFIDHARAVRGNDDGLIARLYAADADGDPLSDEEVAFACIMSFVAGLETTQGLIGNAVHALLDHPDQLAVLRRQPRHVTAAVEEAIRFEAPLQLTKRITTRPCSIGATGSGAGEQILLCLGAANRDSDVFADPDRYDMGRTGAPHVGFGYGMHACLGGMLARVQCEAALRGLIERYREIRRSPGPPQWQSHSVILRGLSALPLTLSA